MAQPSSHSSFTLRWFLQAGLGILLIILLAVHLIVNHWAAPQGLLSYTDIVRYYDHAGIIWMESIFLVVVTLHCLLGLHSILLDLNLRPVITHTLTGILILIGLIALLYGIWLIQIIEAL